MKRTFQKIFHYSEWRNWKGNLINSKLYLMLYASGFVLVPHRTAVNSFLWSITATISINSYTIRLFCFVVPALHPFSNTFCFRYVLRGNIRGIRQFCDYVFSSLLAFFFCLHLHRLIHIQGFRFSPFVNIKVYQKNNLVIKKLFCMLKFISWSSFSSLLLLFKEGTKRENKQLDR